jgi:hypothetical protein
MSINVIVLASDPDIGRIRLAPLLDALVKSGTIADYVMLDNDLGPLGELRFSEFNAVLAQRDINRTQLEYLARSRVRFIYDIDDLLPRLPFPNPRSEKMTRRIAWCLAHADAVSAPNEKLARELGEATGVDFRDRFVILPNGLEPVIVDRGRWEMPAKRLLWVSGDIPLIGTEAPGLAEGIAAATNDLGLQAVLLGRFADRIRSLFRHVEHVPRMAFGDYRRFLASLSETMAIAPLPIHSKDHQAFIDSKSDIKVVDFLGHGIPAVYSAAWPYRNSDLSPGPLLANTAADWRAAITGVAAHPGRYIDVAAVEAVHRLRSYTTVAAALGDRLVTSAMPSRPMPRPSVNAVFRGWERRFRQWRKSV